MYDKKTKAYYWGDKKKMAQKAKEHVTEMQEKFPNEIADSIKKTRVYIESSFFKNMSSKFDTEFSVINTTSEKAVELTDECSVAVLNFASFKFPGGGFLDGSKAQEECLCHASTLYNVISNEKFNFYYDGNKESLNHALYRNRALYSPGIVFNDKRVAVLTCAAPNYTTAAKYCDVSKEQNYQYLWRRIEYVLNIMADNDAQCLILGAFGCGVFGQNAADVASIFKELLNSTFKGVFKKVIFAVPKSDRDTNYDDFKTVFEGDAI